MSAVVYLPRPLLSPDLRKRVERTIEQLIGLLDAVETPGEDLEPMLGAPEQPLSVVICVDGMWSTRPVDQADWAASGDTDEREEEDEHGGDVIDAGEETLGWCENVRQLAPGPNIADGDTTAPERHGKGFVRCWQD